MTIEIDKSGVPHYDGRPELYEEFKDRCWDLFYGRTGQPSLQSATPLTLRSALSGTAYESARKISHTDLMVKFDKETDGPVPTHGMQHLLDKLAEDLIQAKPVRAAELFDKLFFASTVWRGLEKVCEHILFVARKSSPI